MNSSGMEEFGTGASETGLAKAASVLAVVANRISGSKDVMA
jgi:hypothetical protein